MNTRIKHWARISLLLLNKYHLTNTTFRRVTCLSPLSEMHNGNSMCMVAPTDHDLDLVYSIRKTKRSKMGLEFKVLCYRHEWTKANSTAALVIGYV
jgi:hypothetical protein